MTDRQKNNRESDENRLLKARCAQLEADLKDIRSQKDLLQTVLDLIPDSIFAKDSAKRFIVSNKQHYTSLGLDSENDIIGKTDHDFFPDELASEFELVDDDIIRGKTPLVVKEEQGVEPITGEPNYILVSKAYLGEGLGGGLAGIAKNISELKRAIISAEKAQHEAEAANQAKNTFLAKMSHEMRTPLNGIVGISRLLMYSEKDKLKKDQLSIAYNGAEALLSIIGDMIELSNIESGIAEVKFKPFDLRALVAEAFKILFLEDSSTLKVSNIIDPAIPDLLIGDYGKLRQVLVNLLSNAQKFTDNGEISVRVDLLERDNKVQRLRFEVADTGVGISIEHKELIFETFNQIDNSLRRSHGGVGLGLPLSRELVGLLGGKLEFESPSSKAGKGSCFFFDAEFGVFQEDNDTPKKTESVVDFLASLKAAALAQKLLLVEDNPVNQQIALAILKKANLDADVVENGQLAVDAISANEYKLALMDLQMPVMDGLTATRKIRESEKGKHIPIVALTAQALEGDRESCLEAGMNDYVSKPINPDILYSILHKWLFTRETGKTC